jgi:hypothetical protein
MILIAFFFHVNDILTLCAVFLDTCLRKIMPYCYLHLLRQNLPCKSVLGIGGLGCVGYRRNLNTLPMD